MPDHVVETDAGVSRRTLVEACLVAGAVTLSGCTTYDTSVEPPAPEEPTQSTVPHTVPITAIPVGGGVVLKADKIVVTQPTKGEFKAFSAVCTHAGCVVSKVADGTINWPCHGSKYSITDGSVVAGPAPKPLPAKAVNVDGTQIVTS